MYEVFERLCKERSVTPYKISKATGITQTSLSNWKNGKSELSPAGYRKLADYFGVSLDYLMTGEEQEYYINPEAAEIAQQIFEKKGLRTLFDAAKDASPEVLKLTVELLERMKGANPDA